MLLLLLVLLWAVAGGLVGGQTAPLPEGYAGSEACAVCHEDIARDFRRNPHGAIDDSGRLHALRAAAWNSRACESCHGPGKAHTESADATKIFVFKSAAPERVNQQCLACHAGDDTHRGRLFGSHNRNQLACTSCHNIHHASERPLLTTASNPLCQSCHLRVRAEFMRPYRHRLQERAISCVDCHNPHGGLPPRDLRRVSANEIGCLKCHADKRGPFPFEHAPVRLEPCSICHEPHGSANPRMLARNDISLLCLECHTSTLGTIGVTPPAFHDLRSARFRNCTICHSKIHGSFVSRALLR